MNLKSLDIVCASSEAEFYYSKTDDAVPEGVPIGFDIDQGSVIELVLFSDIDWRPNYDEIPHP